MKLSFKIKDRLTELIPKTKRVLTMSLPAVLTQITTIAMQYIDSAMVARLGASASASIGLVATTTWLINGVTYALAAGFSVQAAHHIGGKRNKEARGVFLAGNISALLVSGALCLFSLLIAPYLPHILGGKGDICADSTAYFITYALMLPFSQLNSLNSSFLQCSGNMIIPGILNSAMCVLDIIFNAVFIPRYGVLGAGIGTALACAVVSLAMTGTALATPSLSPLRGKHERVWKESVKKALRIGLPVALQEVAMNGAMVVSTMIIAPLGSGAIAANSFAVTAESLCYMPGYGIGNAATAIVGNSIGKGDGKEAKSYGNLCTALGGILMGVTGAVMMIICPFVFKLLTPDTAVQATAIEILRTELIAEPLFGISIVAAGALRGTGDTLVPGLLNVFSIWVVRIGLSLILVQSMGLLGVWIAMTAELIVRGLLLLYRQLTSKYYNTEEIQA